MTLSLIYRVVGESATSGRKSIASLSLGGDYSESLNTAVNTASTSGVMMVVAAGNDSKDACGNALRNLFKIYTNVTWA